MHEEAPPLKVWAYCALVVFTVLFLFLFYSYSPYGPYGKALERCHRNLTDALIENNTQDTSAISVVILGSSLTERALLNPKEVEDAIYKHTGKKANILRVAIYSMNMRLAERIDLFGYVSKYPPKYLIVENFCMNLDDEHVAKLLPTPIDASLLYLRNYVRKTMHLATFEDYYTKWYTYDTKPLPGNEFYTDKFDSSTFKTLQRKKCVVRKVSQNTIANKAYDTLSKRNTKIIFLDMPQSDKLQTNFLDKSGTVELSKLLQDYKQQYNIDYWQYPVIGNESFIMDDSCFRDGIHVNYKGAIKYQEWFSSQFAAIK